MLDLPIVTEAICAFSDDEDVVVDVETHTPPKKVSEKEVKRIRRKRIAEIPPATEIEIKASPWVSMTNTTSAALTTPKAAIVKMSSPGG